MAWSQQTRLEANKKALAPLSQATQHTTNCERNCCFAQCMHRTLLKLQTVDVFVVLLNVCTHHYWNCQLCTCASRTNQFTRLEADMRNQTYLPSRWNAAAMRYSFCLSAFNFFILFFSLFTSLTSLATKTVACGACLVCFTDFALVWIASGFVFCWICLGSF